MSATLLSRLQTIPETYDDRGWREFRHACLYTYLRGQIHAPGFPNRLDAIRASGGDAVFYFNALSTRSLLRWRNDYLRWRKGQKQ